MRSAVPYLEKDEWERVDSLLVYATEHVRGTTSRAYARDILARLRTIHDIYWNRRHAAREASALHRSEKRKRAQEVPL